MKKLIVFQILLLASVVTFGQQFTLSQKTINLESAAGSSLAKTIQITNNSATDSDFTWTLLNASLKSTWVATLCDPNVCHNTPFDANNSFILSPGKTKTFQLDVETSTECGSGQIAIAVKLDSDPNKLDTVTFNLKAWCTGVEDVKANTPKVILYQEAEGIQVSGISDFKQVKIMDLTGKTISTQSLNGSDFQNISIPFIPKGVYIFHFEKFGVEVNVKFVKL